MINPITSITITGENMPALAEMLAEDGVSFWYSSKRPSVRIVLRDVGRINALLRECRAYGLTTEIHTNRY